MADKRDQENSGIEDKDEVLHSLGDIVWGRQATTCFYPAVVVNDPHFKFFTKIVKSEDGASPGGRGTGRQYHVQFLGDNRFQWVQGHYCLPFKGINHYEDLVIKDVANMKIYKPKGDKSVQWKEWIVIANEMQSLEATERIRKMESARLSEKSGQTFIQKVEKEDQMKSVPPLFSETKIRKLPPSSPKKTPEKDHKSNHYRRQDELEYKMHRDANRSKEKPRKGDHKEPITSMLPVFNTNATFNKSFKIKKDKKAEPVVRVNQEEADMENPKSAIKVSETKEITPEPLKNNMETNSPLVPVSDDILNGKEELSDLALSHQKFEKGTESEGFGEGALIWAKMRGYPYWPSVITRDPVDGEFVKVTETIYKNSRRLHVLFLEYENQRAWIGSSSIKKFQGLEAFKKDKEKASTKTRPDYTPHKRIRSQFDRAVSYAEEVSSLSDEERLEKVLLKYGWAMVLDNDDDVPMETLEGNAAIADNSVVEEAESNVPVGDQGRADSRRSSEEAESRIDPGTDDPDIPAEQMPQSSAKPKKRASSSSAAIANNGDSDSEGDNDNVPPSRKKSKPSLKPAPDKPTTQKPKTPVQPKPAKTIATLNNEDRPEPVPAVKATSGVGDKDEFPRVGDLVWGRMPGFPFWPAFVTRNPDNIYRRELANGKSTFHVQFFNWNDESGWVSSAIEFEGLDAFKLVAKKRKSDKSYNIGKGSSLKKWEKAAREAEDTMGLTRQERVAQYMVGYHQHIQPTKPESSKSATPKTPSTASRNPSGAPKTPSSTSRTPSALQKPSTTPKIPSSARKTASAASKTPFSTPKNQSTSINTPSSSSAASPSTPASSSARKRSLPSGWKSEVRTKDGKEITIYISENGEEMPSKAAMYRHIANLKNSGGVVYLEDETLPSGWRCQMIESSIFFFSPVGQRFKTRWMMAEQMKREEYNQEAIDLVLTVKSRRPAPKSVLVSRGEYESEEEEQEEDDEDLKTLPNGLKFRTGGPYDTHLDIDKIFDPTNGGIIDMVMLPEIFLEHPVVSVKESDNEMIISDVHTGEFIAKKIIYD